MWEIEEIVEQKMARFLRGLNYNIVYMIEGHPYVNFETFCGLCLKEEAQVKSRYGVGSTMNPKASVASKEVSLSKVYCFKCQGFGHYQSACPNQRIVTWREVVEANDELLEEEERSGGTLVFDEQN